MNYVLSLSKSYYFWFLSYAGEGFCFGVLPKVNGCDNAGGDGGV